MATCGVCLKAVTSKQLKVKCEDCKASFHGGCVRVSKTDLETLAELNTVWRCDPCASTRRKSMRMESHATDGSLTMEDVMKVLNDIRDEQAKTVASFNTSNEALHDLLEKNTEALKTQSAKLEAHLKNFEEIVTENKVLRKKVAALESKLEEAEQYSRKNSLEIYGLPQKIGETQEDVIDLVKRVGDGLGLEMSDGMIDACHRLPLRQQTSQSPGVVVKFVRRIDKENLLQKRRERKNPFSTRHIGLEVDTPVYINESLTPERRRLYGQARAAKKSLNYKYVWHRGGKVFLRKSEGDRAIVISCQADLQNLK